MYNLIIKGAKTVHCGGETLWWRKEMAVLKREAQKEELSNSVKAIVALNMVGNHVLLVF